MGLLAQYGSDSDNSDDEGAKPTIPTNPSSVAHASTPTNTTTSALKPKGKRPLVIGTNSALLAKLGVRNQTSDDEDADQDSTQTKKKSKLNNGSSATAPTIQKEGKGKSTLVGMLPPPKRAVPKPPVQPAPLAASGSGSAGGEASKIGTNGTGTGTGGKNPYLSNDGTMLPRVVGKGKVVVKTVEPEVDFFGIAVQPEASSSRLPSMPPTTSTSSITITSAPSAPDFVPPEPSLTDPYPGYYPLPSGQWAAHDPAYYATFFASQDAAPQSGKGGNVDRMWDTELDVEGLESVDVMGRLNEEKRLVEERKKFTAPDLYSEESAYKAVGKTTGKAGQRHQLSALLKDAHSNRAALEERIAANKRTKKDSGAKYGF